MSQILAIKRIHINGDVSYYKKGGTDKTPIDKAQLYYTEAQAQYRLRSELHLAKAGREIDAKYPHWAEKGISRVQEVQLVEVEVSIREKQL